MSRSIASLENAPAGGDSAARAETKDIAVATRAQSNLRFITLQGLQKTNQRVAIVFRQSAKPLLGGLGLAAVPEDRLGKISCPPVMEKGRVAIHLRHEANAPERCRAP